MKASGMTVCDVSVDYGSARALHSVTLDVAPGEVLALIGPSGCGKSTLLRAIAGLVPTSGGTIHIKGRDVSTMSAARRSIGLVPQNYAVFPHLSVADNVAYGLRARRQSKATITSRVGEMLELTQLTAFAGRRPDNLSGGQRQRVALARALAIDPDLVLLDEPLSALDPQLRAGLRRELATLIAQAGYTTIVVTHDQEEAMALGHRVAVLKAGRMVQYGTPEVLYNRPESSFVADFFSGALLLDVAESDSGLTALDGRWLIDATRAYAVGANESRTRVLLRPEDLHIVDSPTTESVAVEVTSVEFAGAHTRLRIRFDESTSCSMLIPATQPVGRSAHVAIKPGALRLV